jgi:hypothetical protein
MHYDSWLMTNAYQILCVFNRDTRSKTKQRYLGLRNTYIVLYDFGVCEFQYIVYIYPRSRLTIDLHFCDYTVTDLYFYALLGVDNGIYRSIYLSWQCTSQWIDCNTHTLNTVTELHVLYIICYYVLNYKIYHNIIFSRQVGVKVFILMLYRAKGPWSS